MFPKNDILFLVQPYVVGYSGMHRCLPWEGDAFFFDSMILLLLLMMMANYFMPHLTR